MKLGYVVSQYPRLSHTFVLHEVRTLMGQLSTEGAEAAQRTFSLLPCVAMWITGVPEVIDHRIEGPLVPPASSAALAAAVERLMDDPDEAQQLAAAARRKVVAKYNLVTNVERLAVEFRAPLPSEAARW